MKYDNNTVLTEQKELCAVTVMKTMLEDMASDSGENFENLMLEFADSNTYDMLFDYDTGLWREGPDYLAGWYSQEKSYNNKAN